VDQLSTQTDYEFGGFRLDTVLQVLVSTSGEPIALPARAYDALRFLVERAGELVDKSALMRAVWPNAVVEENNLNQCILTLRRALGETAGERRFILTVPGRGFKFVAPVRAVQTAHTAAQIDESLILPSAEPAPVQQPVVAQVTRAPRSRYVIIGLAAFAAACLAMVLAFYLRALSGPVTSATEYKALTDLADSATAPVLSPDGKMLTFIGGGGPFLSTGQVYVKVLPNGEPVRLTHIPGPIYGPTFTPDGTRIAFTYVEKRDGSLSWDTYTVLPTGGSPTLLLSNAAGLSWISPRQVMYSEIKTGLHMGIATSADDRSGHREIYLPAHERAMAHYSYVSPDRKSVLVVEMDRAGDWQRCRLIPFDGHSGGEQVGPLGRCHSAAWSPDGKWMYFAADVAGHSHLWRQRYPRGEAEQITFGPTEEEGVAAAADGKSLVTSLGIPRQAIWIHDASGERRITIESSAYAPWFSPDAQRLYFLAADNSGQPDSLWRLDIQRGQRDAVLPGLALKGYDISSDEKQVVFAVDHEGEPQVWVAPLDRDGPPKLLVRGADEPAFDGSGHVFFRMLGDKANYLYRMNVEGTSSQRVLDSPILDFHSVAPNGKWAAVQTVIDGLGVTSVLGIGNETYRWFRNGWWPTRWSRDGRMLYLEVGSKSNDALSFGRTLPIPLAQGAPPEIPALPLQSEDGLIAHATYGFSPGPDAGTFVFTRTERLQNIFRIPLHQ
jgi:DNA-binding winged helix-turn-helix (wHTH) protein/Tol biopolymer transport system component